MTWLGALFRKPVKSDFLAELPPVSDRTLDEETLLALADGAVTASTGAVRRLNDMGLIQITITITPAGLALVREINGRVK